MGDRLKTWPKKKPKARDGWIHAVWQDGHVAGRTLYLPGNRIVLVVWHRFTGQPLASWSLDARDYKALWDEWECEPMAKFLKNVKSAVKPDKDATYAATDKDFAKDHPALVEFMTLRKDDAGNVRATSSLLVFCEDGQWKACFSEREEELTLWASSDSFLGLLEALEAMLESPAPQWRTKSGKRKPKKD